MRKLMIAFALGAALLPLDGYPLGLGEIEVNSALNQELDAEIELLSAVPEDAETLIVKLASREEFSRAGLDRPFLLQSLKFSNVLKNGAPYVKITTSKPIREPFLNFLVEVDWPKGHLLREYTILLDPPVFINEQSPARPAVSSSRPSAAAAPALVPAPVPGGTGSDSPRPAMRAVSPQSSAAPAPMPQQAPGMADAPPRQTSETSASSAPAAVAYAAPRQSADYRIRQGDTAWSLADMMRPDQSVTIEQMMLALLRTNPESFINDNVNGLKRGYILRIPDRDEITSLSQAEAVAMVRQQNALWREYRQHAVDAGAVSAMAKSGASAAATGGARTADARLSIVSAGKGAASGAAGNIDDMSAEELREQLALVEERLETERLEKENLKGEVGDLEMQVSKMKRLLSIEDESLAQMQAATQSKAKTAEPAPAAEPKKIPEVAKPAVDKSAVDKSVADIAAADKLPAVTDTQDMELEAALAEDAPVDDEAVADPFADLDDKPAGELDQAPADAQQQDADSLMLEAPLPPQGMLQKLLNNPLVLAVAGGALLLVMTLVYLIVKRRRANTDAAVSDADFMLDDDLANVADMLDDQAMGQRVSDAEVKASMAAADDSADDFDSDATMILPSANDTVTTEAAGEEEARDDIIAEADVYLAYGIYQQAEELLQNAITEHPDNDAYRMKLAETYFAGKNANSFAELAAVMHKRTKGKGGRWQKIVAMGKDLVPDHELFKGAGASIALDDLVPTPEPMMDIDLGLDDSADIAEPDLDFSLDDDSGLDTAIMDLEDDSATKPMDELEFNLSDADAAASEPDDAEEEFSLDIEASELDISTDDEKADDGGLDFDLDLSAQADNEADDGTLDFDIDASAKAPAAKSSTVADADIDLSTLDDVDEVSTKLDLARAYLDMGDHEGTRSILEEVVEEGNAAQKTEAKALLAEINA